MIQPKQTQGKARVTTRISCCFKSFTNSLWIARYIVKVSFVLIQKKAELSRIANAKSEANKTCSGVECVKRVFSKTSKRVKDAMVTANITQVIRNQVWRDRGFL